MELFPREWSEIYLDTKCRDLFENIFPNYQTQQNPIEITLAIT